MQMAIAQDRLQLTAALGALRKRHARLAFVPTMGALHSGHLSLIEAAKGQADAVVASIFINPKQFGPQEDLARYPRTPGEDVALLEAAGAALLYMPDAADMYPPGFSTAVQVAGVSEGLCGSARPGHFDGVATVVAKLLIRILPDAALFGEKDFQQLMVIKRMAADLDLPVEILRVPTLREEDGLAISSRNRYLSRQEREIAPLLYRTLTETADYLKAHPFNVDNALSLAAYTLSHHGFASVDYVELRHANTLEPLAVLNAPARLLAAVHLGTTRLIDNVAVDTGS